MKERIYSIPLTDALNENNGCILCILEKKLEEDAVNFFLGPSLMEAENRELTNKNGFCRRHMHKLFEGSHKLGIALILETHIPDASNKMELKEGGGLFSKTPDFEKTAQNIRNLSKSCSLCDKLNKQIKDAASNLVYLWDKEPDFREKFEKSPGLCLEHIADVIETARQDIGSKKAAEFVKTLFDLEKNELAEISASIHDFTLSFDYRNNGEMSEKIKNSVPDGIKKLVKYK